MDEAVGGAAGASGAATAGTGMEGEGGAPVGAAGAAGSGGALAGDMYPNLDQLIESMGGPAEAAQWTVFVYGHADHNLSFSLVRDMMEISAANLGEPGQVNVIVLADYDSSQENPFADPPGNYPEGTELFKFEGGMPQVIAKDVELDLDDPAELQRAISLVYSAFPSTRRGLVMWDHGAAWSGGFGHDSQDGTRTDSPGIAPEDIPVAIRSGLAAAGVSAEPPLDFFSFDTCLMANAEVLYPLRAISAVAIANAEIDYGAGWDYTATLSHLAQNPDIAPIDFATAEIGFWDAHHAEDTPSDRVLRSHIGIDLSKVEALGTQIGALAAAVNDGTLSPIDLARAGNTAVPPYSTDLADGTLMAGLRDLGQVLDGLAGNAEPTVADLAATARTALTDLTIGTSQGALRLEQNQAGISIELNRAVGLTEEQLTSYASRAVGWSEATGWGGLLSLIASSNDGTPPVITTTLTSPEELEAPAVASVMFSSDDVDLQSASVLLGIDNGDGTTTVRQGLGSGTVNPGETYEFPWDGMAVTIGGEPGMVVEWIDTGAQEESVILRIPGKLSDGSEEHDAFLIFGNSETAASNIVVVYNGSPTTHTLSEIREGMPSATFAPVLVQLSATGEQTPMAGSPVALPEDGMFQLEMTPVPAGNYVLITKMFDVWGNQAVQFDSVVVQEPGELPENPEEAP